MCEKCNSTNVEYLTTTFKNDTRHVVRCCKDCGKTQYVNKSLYAERVTGSYKTQKQRREDVDRLLQSFD